MKVRDRIVSWATLLCFFAGAALGLLRPDWAQRIAFIGTAYVTALKYLALPALILSVFSAAGKGGKTAAGVLVRAVVLFVAMFSNESEKHLLLISGHSAASFGCKSRAAI